MHTVILGAAFQPQALLSGTFPPNSAGSGYAAEGALLPYASNKMTPAKSHTVSTHCKICNIFGHQDCGINIALKHSCKHCTHLSRVKNEYHLDSMILVLFMLV